MNNETQIEGLNFNTFVWADKQKLPGFQELLNKWIEVHKTYCKSSCRPETSWECDYKERSQVGLLSNAGVLIHGIALEEWGINKKSGEKVWSGRNDLWLQLPSQDKTHDYFIEAKLGHIDLCYHDLRYPVSASQVMGIAINDAKAIPEEGKKVVAISFIFLIWDDENLGDLDKKTSDLLVRMQNEQFGLNALAAIYFSAGDFQKNREERKEKMANWRNNGVGLILMAKLVGAA